MAKSSALPIATAAKRSTSDGYFLLRWLFGPRMAWLFSIPALLILVLVGLISFLAIGRYVSASLESDAVRGVVREVEWEAAMLGHLVPPEQLITPMHDPEHYRELDRFVMEHVKRPGVLRVKIWNLEGTVVYSDEPALIGLTFPVEGKLAGALGGESAAGVSGLEVEDNAYESDFGQLLEVYTPIWHGDLPAVVGVLEVYEDYGMVADRVERSQQALLIATVAGLGAIYLALYLVHRHGARIIGRQQEKVIRQAGELRGAYYATLDALGLALDLRDDGTEGHCQRVSSLAIVVARQLGLGEQEAEKIGRAAIVHDIGKIGLPDRILFKPGPLTEDEWVEMRKHPELGYRMLGKNPVLKHAAETAYSHHERYDGTGYPRGLRGEGIPLSARIFAVVDTYDAITSDRPYRKAGPHVRAMEEIRRCAGSQFDPEVVRAFFEAERKGLVRAGHAGREGAGLHPENPEGRPSISWS